MRFSAKGTENPGSRGRWTDREGERKANLVSRVLYPGVPDFHHLSRPAFARRLHRPTRCESRQKERKKTSSLRFSQPIWSFNTRGLPQCASPRKAVGPYPTFSPLPRRGRGGIFSVALSVPRHPAGAFPLGSVSLCVARTFLPPAGAGRRWNRFAFQGSKVKIKNRKTGIRPPAQRRLCNIFVKIVKSDESHFLFGKFYQCL